MDIIQFFREGMDREIKPPIDFLPGLPVLNLGCGNKKIPDTVGLD